VSRDRDRAHERPFLPAAGRGWLLPLYDPIDRLLGGDAARGTLVQQAALQPGQRVLDLGCGTGNLALLIARRHPGVVVVGIDPDPSALARARRKADRAGVALALDQGFGDALPYADGAFDRVLSAFVLHHIREGDKEPTLREVRRVLKEDGVLHLLDFGASEDGVPTILRSAGFRSARLASHGRLLLGRIGYYRASARD
jgi:ubiquinone/menaquinone biosynthesis C-methylase UbiE